MEEIYEFPATTLEDKDLLKIKDVEISQGYNDEDYNIIIIKFYCGLVIRFEQIENLKEEEDSLEHGYLGMFRARGPIISNIIKDAIKKKRDELKVLQSIEEQNNGKWFTI